MVLCSVLFTWNYSLRVLDASQKCIHPQPAFLPIPTHAPQCHIVVTAGPWPQAAPNGLVIWALGWPAGTQTGYILHTGSCHSPSVPTLPSRTAMLGSALLSSGENSRFPGSFPSPTLLWAGLSCERGNTKGHWSPEARLHGTHTHTHTHTLVKSLSRLYQVVAVSLFL
jgi:hypothetical protein